MTTRFHAPILALALLAPAAATLVATPAAAQQRAAPEIRALTLNSDHGLAPGARLTIQLRGTPQARAASVRLADGVTVPLSPAGAGTYRGVYTVRSGDRIDPMDQMEARLTVGRLTTAKSFYYPTSFQSLAMGGPPAAAAPDIERFVMRPDGPLEPGRELRLRVRGAPGAEAWVDIPGVIRGLRLDEVRPGVYEGHYTVRQADDPAAFDDARVTLQDRGQRVSARVDRRAGAWDRRG